MLVTPCENGGLGLDPEAASKMTPRQASILFCDEKEIKRISLSSEARDEAIEFHREKSKNWNPRHRKK